MRDGQPQRGRGCRQQSHEIVVLAHVPDVPTFCTVRFTTTSCPFGATCAGAPNCSSGAATGRSPDLEPSPIPQSRRRSHTVLPCRPATTTRGTSGTHPIRWAEMMGTGNGNPKPTETNPKSLAKTTDVEPTHTFLLLSASQESWTCSESESLRSRREVKRIGVPTPFGGMHVCGEDRATKKR